MPVDNSKYNILILEPTLQEPEKIIRMLEEADFHTRQVNDIHQAIEILKTNQATLLIFGQAQAQFAPEDIIHELKKDEHTRHTPVLLITTDISDHFFTELSYDNLDFVTSSFLPAELITRIQHQLLLLKTERTILKQNINLKKTLEARDKLYSVIAHDLRAPIGTIKMINSSIESQKSKIKDPGILKLFSMINETTEEAFNLLENLLRWTRNQNGKTKIYATSFNLTKAIRQVASLFTTIAESKNITLNNHATLHSHIYADEDMIKSVLRNLISNAIKFTYPGGKIDIDLTDLPECVLVSVKDNGKGISKELQSKLLKPNEYITTYGTRNEKGSGLGLVLSQEFIKMNKGKFWFVSQEGIGSTFFFSLPRAQAGS